MKKISWILILVALVAGCNNGPEFNVKGEVSGAEGKTIYLEASGLEGGVALDSAKLKESGVFSFKSPAPQSPEFYRLRMDDKVINFSVDSTETIEINAAYNNFTTGYEVSGSESSRQIKELVLKQISLQKRVSALIKAADSRQIRNQQFEDSLSTLLANYKDSVKREYIFAAPYSAPAYFALFQTVNNYYLFDPLNNKEDVKCFAAVATSYNNFYPDALRTKNLYNLALKGMRNTRTPRENLMEIPEDIIQETSIIDISLKDIKGNTRTLTSLKGKVVLLDFTIYQSAVSAPHNYTLHDLYDKYKDKGLEIYQVSLDADEHYWKTVADNLPWICVRDANGIYSQYAALYTVQELPTYFLINRNNELSVRGEDIQDLENRIKSML
ncbi:MAG: AhpC/TSA family protein [Bacteroides sp.]|nr:AhpC/TSA family protein [Bacteroides sp.]